LREIVPRGKVTLHTEAPRVKKKIVLLTVSKIGKWPGKEEREG